jgi:hypothetical protein
MPRLSIWNSGRKSNNYKFIDRSIAQYFQVGGTAILVHKYIGIQDPNGVDENGNPNGVAPGGETKIQDILFLENRDRAYAPDVYELRGIYNVSDSEFDLSQFGLFLQNDTVFIEVHLNDMIKILGRKLMPGDVIELPHLRDDALLDPNAPAINKFYSISDSDRASDGYSQTWYPHIWRVKCAPLTDSQEYEQILQQNALDPFGLETNTKLQDIMSNVATTMGIDNSVVAEAKQYVKERYFQTQQYYIVPGDEIGSQYPWVFAGDGVPPDGAVPVGAGNVFPINANVGDYYLRTDYEPNVLFQKDANGSWIRQELDYRQQDWSMATRVLESFINNNNTTTLNDGSVVPQKQPLSRVVLPKVDF